MRDGAQGEGLSFSVEDKLKIAAKVDFLGVDYIEGGWPGSNPKDMEFFQRVGGLQLEHARIVAFSSTRRPNVQVTADQNIQALLQSGVKAAAIFGKTWDFHVTTALGTTLEENLAMIRDTVAYLKENGLEVIYDAEHFFDGYKNNPEYALNTLRVAAEAGADWIVPCDTNGGTLPWKVAQIIAQIRETVNCPVGIHAHNDSELAVANTLMAVQAGASMVQGTINGYGERCGNSDLCSVVANLELKLGRQCLPPKKLEHLLEVSHYVGEIANMVHHSNQPFVGRSAFAHKAGIHVSAVKKNPHTYEHIRPEAVGNRRRILVSELSGQSNLMYKMSELNLKPEQLSGEARQIVQQIKELEHQGFQFEAAEASLELMLQKAAGQYQDFFSLENLKILMEKKGKDEIISEAIIKIRVGDQYVHTAAEGDGPVHALDNALRKALDEFYPVIQDVHLSDYKVRVLNEKEGTQAKVRVLIESANKQGKWSTVGVSANIIEASWQALADSINYALLKQSQTKSGGNSKLQS